MKALSCVETDFNSSVNSETIVKFDLEGVANRVFKEQAPRFIGGSFSGFEAYMGSSRKEVALGVWTFRTLHNTTRFVRVML